MFLLWNPLLAQTQIPNGLCVIECNGGHAHGFIVGNSLFSSLHVLERGPTRVFCYQNGAMAEISDLLINRTYVHPATKEPGVFIDGYDALLQIVKTDPNQILEKVRTPYDLGYLPLSEKPPSDFLFDPSETVKDASKLHPSIAPGELAQSVRLGKKFEPRHLQTAYGLSAFQYGFDREKLWVGPLPAGDGPFNVYHDYDMGLQPGDSGLPVYLPMPGEDPKYLVVGVVRGGTDKLHPSPSVPTSELVPPAQISASPTLASWLKTSRPKLFLGGANTAHCAAYLAAFSESE